MPFFNGKEIFVLKISLIVLLMCSLPYKASASQDENTHFCKSDCTMEYNLFKKYARKGSALANLSMAIMNYQGQGRAKNFKLAKKQLISAARAGEPAAMHQLGYNLLFGLYIKQDIEKSLIWFQRAFKQGVENSEKYIIVINDFLKIENEKTKSTLKNVLSENKKTQERNVTLQDSNDSIEHISVTFRFDWSFVLHDAEQQTCHMNCNLGFSHTLFPIIHLINEKALLDNFKKLTNNKKQLAVSSTTF